MSNTGSTVSDVQNLSAGSAGKQDGPSTKSKMVAAGGVNEIHKNASFS
jgi:hypothetical protein